MIFVDTSAIYAVLDQSDRNHGEARILWAALLASDTAMFTTNYVVVESCALLQNRLGIEAVRIFHEDILPVITIR